MKGVYARASGDQIATRQAILDGLQGRPLAEKIAVSSRIITAALGIGKPALLYSGGRDSTVLLDLVAKQSPDILVIHNNTTLGDPALAGWVQSFVNRTYPGADYRETVADDPIAMWQERGYFPLLSKRGFTAYKMRDPHLRISPVQCCYQLKEKKSNAILNAEETAVVFWGNRAAESMRRRLTFIDNGYLFKPKKYRWHQAYPLQHFTGDDITAYLGDHVKNYPASGAAFETGCLCCGTDITFWPNNLGRLYQRDRPRWEYFMRAGFAEQIAKMKGLPGDPEEIISTRPELLLCVNTRKRGPNQCK